VRICPSVKNTFEKSKLMLHMSSKKIKMASLLSLKDELAAYQLVGEVMAYQGDDG
jgi:hypothetical protein